MTRTSWLREWPRAPSGWSTLKSRRGRASSSFPERPAGWDVAKPGPVPMAPRRQRRAMTVRAGARPCQPFRACHRCGRRRLPAHGLPPARQPRPRPAQAQLPAPARGSAQPVVLPRVRRAVTLPPQRRLRRVFPAPSTQPRPRLRPRCAPPQSAPPRTAWLPRMRVARLRGVLLLRRQRVRLRGVLLLRLLRVRLRRARLLRRRRVRLRGVLLLGLLHVRLRRVLLLRRRRVRLRGVLLLRLLRVRLR